MEHQLTVQDLCDKQATIATNQINNQLNQNSIKQQVYEIPLEMDKN